MNLAFCTKGFNLLLKFNIFYMLPCCKGQANKEPSIIIILKMHFQIASFPHNFSDFKGIGNIKENLQGISVIKQTTTDQPLGPEYNL
jgi:hypothetical protein